MTFTVIMPIGGWLFTGMSWLFLHLNGNPFGWGSLAGLFLLAVDVRRHQGLCRSILRWWMRRALTRCFLSWRWPGLGRWVRAGVVLAREARFAAGTQIKGGDYSGLPRYWRTADLRRDLAAHETVYHRLDRGAGGGFFVGLIAWLGLPVGLNTVFGPSGL